MTNQRPGNVGYVSVKVPVDAADVFKYAVRRNHSWRAPKTPSRSIQRLLETLGELTGPGTEARSVWIRYLAEKAELDPGNTNRQVRYLSKIGFVAIEEGEDRKIEGISEKGGGMKPKWVRLTSQGRKYLELCGERFT